MFSIRSGEQTHQAHFWELGGGRNLEKTLNTIFADSAIQFLTIFVCFDLTQSISIREACLWLPMIANRFHGKQKHLFMLGSHYNEFSEKDPSVKARIVEGLRATAFKNHCGLIFFSPKNDLLSARIRTIVKSIIFSDTQPHEISIAHTSPVCVWYGEDTETDGDNTAFMHQLDVDCSQESSEKKNVISDPSEDPLFADKSIDALRKEKNRALSERLKVLQASVVEN